MVTLHLVTEDAAATSVDELVRTELDHQYETLQEPARSSIVGVQLLARQATWAADHLRIDTYAIRVEGELVGRLLLAPSTDHTVVVDVLVTGPRRRQGIGTETLRLVVEQVAGPLRLRLAHAHPARAAVHRLGFTEVTKDDTHVDLHLQRD